MAQFIDKHSSELIDNVRQDGITVQAYIIGPMGPQGESGTSGSSGTGGTSGTAGTAGSSGSSNGTGGSSGSSGTSGANGGTFAFPSSADYVQYNLLHIKKTAANSDYTRAVSDIGHTKAMLASFQPVSTDKIGIFALDENADGSTSNNLDFSWFLSGNGLAAACVDNISPGLGVKVSGIAYDTDTIFQIKLDSKKVDFIKIQGAVGSVTHTLVREDDADPLYLQAFLKDQNVEFSGMYFYSIADIGPSGPIGPSGATGARGPMARLSGVRVVDGTHSLNTGIFQSGDYYLCDTRLGNVFLTIPSGTDPFYGKEYYIKHYLQDDGLVNSVFFRISGDYAIDNIPPQDFTTTISIDFTGYRFAAVRRGIHIAPVPNSGGYAILSHTDVIDITA